MADTHTVHLADGSVVHFPAYMTPADIEAAIANVSGEGPAGTAGRSDLPKGAPNEPGTFAGGFAKHMLTEEPEALGALGMGAGLALGPLAPVAGSAMAAGSPAVADLLTRAVRATMGQEQTPVTGMEVLNDALGPLMMGAPSAVGAVGRATANSPVAQHVIGGAGGYGLGSTLGHEYMGAVIGGRYGAPLVKDAAEALGKTRSMPAMLRSIRNPSKTWEGPAGVKPVEPPWQPPAEAAPDPFAGQPYRFRPGDLEPETATAPAAGVDLEAAAHRLGYKRAADMPAVLRASIEGQLKPGGGSRPQVAPRQPAEPKMAVSDLRMDELKAKFGGNGGANEAIGAEVPQVNLRQPETPTSTSKSAEAFAKRMEAEHGQIKNPSVKAELDEYGAQYQQAVANGDKPRANYLGSLLRELKKYDQTGEVYNRTTSLSFPGVEPSNVLTAARAAVKLRTPWSAP